MKKVSVKAARDVVTFLVGSAGLAYETLSSGLEKPTLIIAFVGLMGLPLFVRKDESATPATPIPPAPTAPSALIPTPDVTPEVRP